VAQTENILSAFSVDHAARVTGLSKSRLTRWDKFGFFSPEYADDDRSNPYSRIYSFIDLVGLRTLAILSDAHKVPLDELRKTYGILSKTISRPWSESTLYVWNRKVGINEPVSGQVVNVTDGQFLGKHIELLSVATEIAQKAEKLKVRQSSSVGKIVRHKFVAHNARIIDGTRIPVSAVVEFLEEGFSATQIIAEYPTLKKADISAVRKYMKAAA
jgi:uncharacterized protein (DUF433 family)